MVFAAAASLNHYRQNQELERRTKKGSKYRDLSAAPKRAEKEEGGVIQPPKPFKEMTAKEYMDYVNRAGGGVI